MKEVTEAVVTRVRELREPARQEEAPQPLLLGETATREGNADFPMLGRLRRDMSIEHLIGDARLEPILRPIQLTLVADRVNTFNDVTTAMRHSVELCTLMGNQSDLIKNTYCLRLSLLQHLFTTVIPLPLPHNHPDRDTRCFWASANRAEPMRHETQSDILRLLHLLCRHYAACCLSVKATRSFDATRILTVGCIAAISDAVLRVSACDVPNQLSAHYNGTAPGPIHPFGFEMNHFAKESAKCLLTTPDLQTARTQVLDYFHQRRSELMDSHVIFKYEDSMGLGSGEAVLIDQLCVQMGFPRGSEDPEAGHMYRPNVLARYLSGEDPIIIDNYPELGLFRDIVFTFKLLQVPTNDGLPELKPWLATDAALSWKFKVKQDEKPEDENEEHIVKSKFVVRGFSSKELSCAYTLNAAGDHSRSKPKKGVMGKVKGFFGLVKLPRAPPSGADPSNLLESNDACETEDDILHIKELPDFDKTLSARDCELLLQYLTVPYLRIPLVMEFFSKQFRLAALSNTSLQAVLDACLFEPGTWQSEYVKPVPEVCPAPDRDHLTSPVGLLFNELQKCHEHLASCLEAMLSHVMELDTGRYSEHTSPVVLYVVRLIVRVEAFLLFVVRHSKWHHTQSSAGEAYVTRSGFESSVRGLLCDDATVKALAATQQRMRKALNLDVYPMLENWLQRTTKDESGQACVLHAHLALLFSNVTASQLDRGIVSTFLCAQIFLTMNYRFDVDVKADDGAAVSGAKKTRATEEEDLTSGLGIEQLEVFDLFQRHRYKIIEWLKANPTDCDEIMEGIVRVVTYTGRRNEPSASRGASGIKDRHWESMMQPGCEGRFVPDTELANRKPIEATAGMPFEEWLRLTTTQSVDTEINLQLGDFTLKKHHMEMLNDDIHQHPDYVAVFGARAKSANRGLGGVQCAEVKNTTMRKWVRIVGQRHDVQQWQPDLRLRANPRDRNYRSGINPGERWISAALDDYVTRFLDKYELFLPTEDCSSKTEVVIYAFPIPEEDEEDEKGKKKKKKKGEGKLAKVKGGINAGVESGMHGVQSGIAYLKGLVDVPMYASMKEVVVFKDPASVMCFDVVEHGRRHYHSLCHSSSVARCMHDMTPKLTLVRDGAILIPQLVAGDNDTNVVPTPSLVVTRALTSDLGSQTHIPQRFLLGLMPTAVLDQYDFWQNEDDGLSGYERPGTRNPSQPPSMIQVKLFTSGPKDETGYGGAKASAAITRIPVVENVSKSGADSKQMRRQSLIKAMGGKNVAVESKTLTSDIPGAAAADVAPDKGKPVHTLLNVLHAPGDSALGSLGKVMQRVENLGHVLVWTKGLIPNPLAACSIDKVELPRLRLSFSVKSGDEHKRLYCDDHAGLYLVDTAEELEGTGVPKLLQGLPHSLLLRDEYGQYSIMLPSCALPMRPLIRGIDGYEGPGALFPTDLVLDRRNTKWLSNLPSDGVGRYYLYPVHISGLFLFTPTLASSLCMLILRFLARDYDAVARSAASCVSDTPLSPEEQQLWDQLEFMVDDYSPDATACRLKLSLATYGCQDVMPLPWQIASELDTYNAKRRLVSGACRLSPEEELMLTDARSDDGEVTQASRDRKAFLEAVAGGTKHSRVKITPPTIPICYDAVVDRSIVESSSSGSMGSRFTSLSYKRPIEKDADQTVVNEEKVMEILHHIATHGITLAHATEKLGFPFLYEVFTGSLDFRLLPTDSGWGWASMLCRFLPQSDFNHTSVSMSTLRVLSLNKKMSTGGVLPSLTTGEKLFKRMKNLVKGEDPVTKLIKNVHTYMASKQGDIVWPEERRRPDFVMSARISFPEFKLLRTIDVPNWTSTAVANLEQGTVHFKPTAATFDATAVSAFANAPLEPLEGGLAAHIVELTREDQGLETISSELCFDVSKHTAAKSVSARAILERMKQDAAVYAEKGNAMKEARMKYMLDDTIASIAAGDQSAGSGAAGSIAHLLESLRALQAHDMEQQKVHSARALEIANGNGSGAFDDAAGQLAMLQRVGTVPTIWFELIVALLLSTSAVEELQVLNPMLTAADAEAVLNSAVAAMVIATRIGQLTRCIEDAKTLLSAVEKAQKKQSSEAHVQHQVAQDLSLKSKTLATGLSATRNYMNPGGSAGEYEFDPRFLAFEYTYVSKCIKVYTCSSPFPWQPRGCWWDWRLAQIVAVANPPESPTNWLPSLSREYFAFILTRAVPARVCCVLLLRFSFFFFLHTGFFFWVGVVCTCACMSMNAMSSDSY